MCKDLILQRNTCSDDKTEQKCNCNICLTARFQRLSKNTGLYISSELVYQILNNKTP